MKRSAVVAVTGPTGLVLTLRRSASDPWKPHHWNFPGGGVAKHESLTEGAVRELYEESGILVQPYSLRPLFYFYPRKGHQVAVFATTLNTYPAVSFADGEHDDFKWSSFNNLPSPSIPLFDKVARAVALRLLDTQSNIEDGKQGDQTMSRHYNTSEYMAHWPLAIPYPYEITRSRRPVPNASSVNWPQAQFAPLYLKAGSPSFQPYKYRSKPERYPPGADVFSIFPGPNTLKFSTKPMNERLRRQWMRRPDGDIIRVPQYGYSGGQLARPNIFPLLAAAGAIGVAVSAKKKKKDKEALAAAKAKAKEAGLSSKGAYADPKGRSADTWTVGHSINYEADKGWGVNLSDGCQARLPRKGIGS